MSTVMEIFPTSPTNLVPLFSFIILVFSIGFNWLIFHSKTKKNLPPSPPKLPIIGNFHQLGSSPHRSLQALSHKHGPLILIHLGSMPTLVASSAEAAREIMKTHDLSFCNRPSLKIPTTLFYGGKDIAFSSYGEYWRQLKSIVVLNILSNKRVKSFRSVREEEMGHMISKIENSNGELVDLSALLVTYTNNIFCRVALGKTYQGLNFMDLLKDFVEILGVACVGDYIPWLSWVDSLRGVEQRAQKISEDFNKFLENVIQEHLNKKIEENSQCDEGQDLVDVLLDVLKDNTTDFILYTKAVIMDLFAAGTHTVFATLDWAISELVRHPSTMKKLQDEVTGIVQGRPMIVEEDLDKMIYLKAVIKEALRLHAPGPLLVPRESREEVKLMGYDIPKGTQVIINAWAIGRDPALWEHSEEFMPERFLNTSVDYKGLDFEWLVFGAGRRGCPGIQFTVPMVELALANAVYKFNLALPNGLKIKDLDMSEASAITVYRKSPLLVMATPRLDLVPNCKQNPVEV